MLLLPHSPIHQLVYSGLYASRPYLLLFPVVDQPAFVGAEIRKQLVDARANLLKARHPPHLLLRQPGVDINPTVKRRQRDVGSVDVAMPDLPFRPVQLTPVTAQPVSEVLKVRKINEAFADGLKAPHDVIPIQDMLFVCSEPASHHRPHPVLTV